MKPTLQCHCCKQQFPRGELVAHAGPRAAVAYNYCPACLKQVESRELFSEKICHIFGLKAPGPRIWKERERIIEQYGYTDQTIIDCLDYLYNVENYKKFAESLCLVTPANIEKMIKYKHKKEYEANKIVDAFTLSINNKNKEIRKIKLNDDIKEEKKWNLDDYFFDD